jgi:hypothetical protein
MKVILAVNVRKVDVAASIVVQKLITDCYMDILKLKGKKWRAINAKIAKDYQEMGELFLKPLKLFLPRKGSILQRLRDPLLRESSRRHPNDKSSLQCGQFQLY